MAMAESHAVVTSDLLSGAARALSSDSARAAVGGAPCVDGEGLLVHAGVGGVSSAGRRAGGHAAGAQETNKTTGHLHAQCDHTQTDRIIASREMRCVCNSHTWGICAASC